MTLDRPRISQLVPQTGAMCLLDEVIDWGPAHVSCKAQAPGADHPLLRDGRVPAVMAVEYAAQACAVHGALSEPATAQRAGVLASLVDVDLRAGGVPLGEGPIAVDATMLGRTGNGCLYGFSVAVSGSIVVEGRLVVALSPVGAA
jgi:predicted hotdog family 3-hydroxylacyl-ACP dehydratase